TTKNRFESRDRFEMNSVLFSQLLNVLSAQITFANPIVMLLFAVYPNNPPSAEIVKIGTYFDSVYATVGTTFDLHRSSLPFDNPPQFRFRGVQFRLQPLDLRLQLRDPFLHVPLFDAERIN